MDRRQFLSRAGLVAGATVAAGSGETLASLAAQPRTTVNSSWNGVRSQFDLARDYLHFAAPVLASHPAPVRDAIDRYRRELDRNTKLYLYANEVGLEEDEVLGEAGRYLDAGLEDVALTDSTTMGLGTFYAGLALTERDEVLTTTHDFYATHEALRMMSERTGARVREISLYPEDAPHHAAEDRIVDSIIAGVTPNTRAVAVTWVHSSSGVKLPIAAIAAALRERSRNLGRRVLLFVDGVHGLGVEDETVATLGCDALISGCHKWMFGPRGTGVVWANTEAWSLTTPTIPSFDGRAYGAWLSGQRPTDVPPARLMTPGGFHSFEHRWALADAFRFHEDVGKSAIAKRTHDLATQLKEGLADLEGIEVATPATERLSSGIVCFSVRDLDPQVVVDTLERRLRVVASVSPYRQPFVRFMTSIVNSPDEIEEALLAIRTLRPG